MNKRTVSIIQELGNVEKEMTIKGLAESFGVSQRTRCKIYMCPKRR